MKSLDIVVVDVRMDGPPRPPSVVMSLSSRSMSNREEANGFFNVQNTKYQVVYRVVSINLDVRRKSAEMRMREVMNE